MCIRRLDSAISPAGGPHDAGRDGPHAGSNSPLAQSEGVKGRRAALIARRNPRPARKKKDLFGFVGRPALPNKPSPALQPAKKQSSSPPPSRTVCSSRSCFPPRRSRARAPSPEGRTDIRRRVDHHDEAKSRVDYQVWTPENYEHDVRTPKKVTFLRGAGPFPFPQPGQRHSRRTGGRAYEPASAAVSGES